MSALKYQSWRYSLLLASLMAFPALSLSAQEDAYHDRGILAVTIEVDSVRLVEENAGLISFRVSATYRFVNRGMTPALLYVGEGFPWLGGVYLACSKDSALLGKYVHLGTAWPSVDTEGYLHYRTRLDQSTPPPDLVRVIEPGKHWVYKRDLGLGIEKKGSFDKSSKPWDEIRWCQLWLQVEFQTWPRNLEKRPHEPNPKFGRRLQKRWKANGELILENIRSEPVPLNLPDRQK